MSRAVLTAAVGFVVAIAALVLTWSLRHEEVAAFDSVVPQTLEPVPSVPAPSPSPTFDVLRVGEKGDAVVAGRAQPQSEVSLLDGDRELGRAQVDERGEWVLLPSLPLAHGARALWLEARGADGVVRRSAAPVIVVVPEGAAHPALAVVPEAEGGARLVLGPGGETGPVSIELADCDGSGRLFLGGRAAAGAMVLLYLNNRFLGRAVADGEEGWRLSTHTAETGTVRADLVDARARVLARVEVPLAPPAPGVGSGGESVAAVPGASSWTIARPGPGGAAAYSVIYLADKARARDAAHVYPGQLSQLPKN